MVNSPSSYLVLASQRSGSTLLVESLRSTGVAGAPEEFFQYLPTTSRAPQPREWFTGVDDESILTLLDPFDPGTPDLADATTWRDYVRTAGRSPNGVWGGKLMWNQTTLLQNRAKDLPDRSLDGLLSAICDVIGERPLFIHVYRPDVVAQAVSLWRAIQTGSWRGRSDPLRDSRAQYHPRAIAHLVVNLCAQEECWRSWFAEEGVTPIEISYPVLWRSLADVTGRVLDALGLDPVVPSEALLERQADDRSRNWVDQYRIDAGRYGLPTCACEWHSGAGEFALQQPVSARLTG